MRKEGLNMGFVSVEEMQKQALFIDNVRSLILDKGLKACVFTLGCQQNEADSERMRGILKGLGYEITYKEEEADLLLVNTCAIREHAEKRALSIVGRYKHYKTKNLGNCLSYSIHKQLKIHLLSLILRQ